MPSPGRTQESRAQRERPRGKAGGCELPGSPATPQSTEEKEDKGSGEFTWAKDELASALPPRCAALLQVGAPDGGTLPAGPRAVIAAIIFFSKCFHMYCNLGSLLKNKDDNVPEAVEQREQAF